MTVAHLAGLLERVSGQVAGDDDVAELVPQSFWKVDQFDLGGLAGGDAAVGQPGWLAALHDEGRLLDGPPAGEPCRHQHLPPVVPQGLEDATNQLAHSHELVLRAVVDERVACKKKSQPNRQQPRSSYFSIRSNQ